MLLTVNGIGSAQRFTLIEGAFAPSLALYTITSPAVLQDAYYIRIRGMGLWLRVSAFEFTSKMKLKT